MLFYFLRLNIPFRLIGRLVIQSSCGLLLAVIKTWSSCYCRRVQKSIQAIMFVDFFSFVYFQLKFISSCFQEGDTILIKACNNGHHGVVDMLLSHGAEVNTKGNVCIFFILHLVSLCSLFLSIGRLYGFDVCFF